MTIVPPGRRDRIEWDQVAAPTVSITASTFSGSRDPGSNTASAPTSSARARLASVRARRPHPVSGGVAQHQQRRGHTAARPLHEHRRAGLRRGVGEQHAVGGQPCSGQAGGLRKGERCRLGHEVATRHADLLGQRTVELLREQTPAGVERLVAGPVRTRDDRVDHHLVAVLVDPRGVAAEHHRKLLGGDPRALEGPEVVVVQRRRLDVHAHPTLRWRGLRPLPDGEADERVVGVDRGGGDGEHRSYSWSWVGPRRIGATTSPSTRQGVVCQSRDVDFTLDPELDALAAALARSVDAAPSGVGSARTAG